MNREEYAKLTPEEQRIKVAELCGWRPCKCGGLFNGYPECGNWIPKGTPIRNWKSGTKLPDYLHDLNAMAEAEKLLNEGQLSTYASMLSWSDNGYLADWQVVTTTASQRAEAFVLTMAPE